MIIVILSSVVDCGDLSPPPYGNVTLNSTLYQSLAVYYCSYGYDLIGNSSRYCQANGQWSGEEPICESKYLGSYTLLVIKCQLRATVSFHTCTCVSLQLWTVDC